MIDVSWIDYWAGEYNSPADDKLLDEVGPRVRERGYYDREDFLAVGRWKSPRATSQTRGMASNSDEMIRDVTCTALAAPFPIQHLILSKLLQGVAVPMASSLLMVWQPEQHTVIDVRAVKSLVTNNAMPAPQHKYPPYMEYLAVCKGISERTGRSLRMLDRALFEANGRT